MARFVLTAAANNFSGQPGQFNLFFFTPSTLQAADTIAGGATGVFLDEGILTAGGTVSAAQFGGVSGLEELDLSSGGNSVTLPDALVAGSSTGFFTVVDSNSFGWSVAGSGDVDGDGKADLVWRRADGTVAIDPTAGDPNALATPSGGGASDWYAVGNEWHIKAGSDFNGDHKTDLLWRADDGTVAEWQLNGTQILSSTAFGNVGLEWSIAATGDFNGDGKSDILWRNADGSVAEWQLNGSQIQLNAGLGNVGAEWHIVSAADFNGDGKSDILWQADDGSIAEWQMNGTQVQANTGLGKVGAEWHILATADFNGDGKNDILWQANDGSVAEWQMNGAQILANTSLGKLGPEWHFVTTGDFNGDGKSDILWRSDDGTEVIWNGSQVQSQQVVTGGNDTIDASAAVNGSVHAYIGTGSDTVIGGAQADQIFTPNSNFASIDGGGGDDRLVLTSAGQVFNLTANNAKIHNTEVLWLADAANTSVTLGGADIAQVSASANYLYVVGGADDHLNAGDQWTIAATNVTNAAIAPGHTFTDYRWANGSHLFVDTAISLSIGAGPTIPVDSNAAANSIAEGAANGTAVGITAFSSTAGVTYSLSNSAGGRFAINSSTGVVTVANGTLIDFENSGTGHSFGITVQAADGAGGTSLASFTIGVTDVNDTAPTFTSSAAASVAENTTAVVDLTTTDPDTVGGPSTFTITGGADQALFQITGGNHLSFKAARDFETQAHSYAVQVTASDGVNSTTQNIAVTLTDTNDTAPVFTSSATRSVAENTTAVVDLTATDADTVGTNPSIFTISGGADAALFQITGGNHLSFKAARDFETQAHSYAVQVTAGDGVNSTTQNIAVTLTDTNDTAPTFTSSATPSVVENTTAVVDLTTTDPDTSGANPATFTITGGADAGLFQITGGNHLSFKATRDFDTQAHSYAVQVTASDGVNSSVQNIAVALTDANDRAPVFTSSAAPNVAENSTAVLDLTTSDADTVGTNPAIFTITGGADAGLFQITGGNHLSFIAARDFETQAHSYVVQVTANDGANSTAQDITVTLTDVNEFTPVINSDGGLGTASLNVAENTTAVTTVTATDADGTAALTYSIAGGLDAGVFMINSSTGALLFTSAPDFENPNDVGLDGIYEVTVQASDGLHTDTQAISVTVTDQNDAPLITSGGGTTASYSVQENSTAVATIAAFDQDASGSVTFSINGGADASLFTIDPSTGDLSFLSAPDFENPGHPGSSNQYDVVVQVTDGVLTKSQDITVTVQDVNEAPTDLLLSGSGTVDENSPVGTVVGTLSAVDQDAGETFTYTLLDDSDGKFALNGTNLVVNGPIDFESEPDHALTVQIRATDSAGNVHGESFTLTINDLPELSAPDGYIAGATIFSDSNGNFQLDAGENSTTSDQFGNFTFQPGTGTIVLTGGNDIAKGSAFNAVMLSPEDATIISPLTTLVTERIPLVGDETTANNDIVSALNLDPSINLTHYDPILATLSSVPATANAGAAAIKAATEVEDTIAQGAAVLVGSGATVTNAAVAIANAIAGSIGSLDLTSESYLTSVINTAATSLGVLPDGAVVTGAAQIIAASNIFVTSTAQVGAALLTTLTQIGRVADQAAVDLQTADSSTIAGIVDAYRDDGDTDLTDKINGESGNVQDVQGANGDNTLNGTAGPDVLYGFGGNDTLIGGDGADTLDGGDGNDTLSGGLGKDTLIGGAGDDNMDGGDWYNNFNAAGAGDVDRASYADAPSAVTVDLSFIGTPQNTGGAGIDTLNHIEGIIGSAFDDHLFGGGTPVQDFLETFRGGAGNDIIDGRSGNDRAEYNDATGAITVHLAAGTVTGAGVGTDTLLSVEDIRGSDSGDTYDATGFGPASTNAGSKGTFNNFRPEDGDDTIIGNGDTQLDYFDAPHAVTVNLSDRSINSTTGVVHGGVGIGDDKFSGIDRVRGSAFADTLIGGQQEFSAPGDAEFFEGVGGNDFINGGSGFDYSRYIVTTVPLSGVQVQNPITNATVTVGIYVDLASGVVIGDPLNYGTDTLRGIEGIMGTVLDDIYDARGFGPNSVNAQSPGIGINEFEGGAGNDLIIGNGSTRISYVTSTTGVVVDLSINNNGSGTVTGDQSVGTDTIVSGVSSIRGSAFNDTLTGFDNATGTQTFDGRGGDDTIDGRGGFDRVVYNSDSTVTHGINLTLTDTVVGSVHTLTGSISGATNNEVGDDHLSNIESVTGTDFDDTLTATGIPASGGGFTGFGAIEFEGGAGNDTISGIAVTGTFTRVSYSTSTGDVVVTFSGTPGSGVADGDASVGHDTLTNIRDVIGSLNDDTITGRYTSSLTGLDNQTFQGGAAGNDVLQGGSGNDTLWGGDSNNSNGTERYDGITPSGFNDIDYASYAGANGAVTVNLLTGTGTIPGSTQTGDFGSASGANAGNDTLVNIEGVIGSAFADTLSGGNYFFETFRGGAGNDTINGNGGNDNADYSDAAGAVTINLAAGTASGAGVDTDTLHSVESIWGSSSGDSYNAAGFSGTSANAGSLGTFNSFRPGDGDDAITGNDNTVIDYSNAPHAINIDLTSGSFAGGAGIGTDTFTHVNQVMGTAFADTLTGGQAAYETIGTFEGFWGMAGDDTINGAGGFDRASYNLDGNISVGISVDLAAGTVTGDPTLTGTDTLSSVEAIGGSILADTFDARGFGTGSVNAGSNGSLNEFEGYAGNDTILGNGNTRVAFYHASAGVVVDLAAGTATGDNSVGTDTFSGVSRVTGSNFGDTISGDSGSNIIDGQGGNDRIDGKAGNDQLTGGVGDDTFVFGPAFGKDVITDFIAGQGTIDKMEFDHTIFANAGAVIAASAQVGADVVITFDANDSITLKNVTLGILHADDFIFV
jgi:Ca2+-binding RTX toxin-like protein